MIDSASDVSKEAKSILDANGLLNRNGASAKDHRFFVSDEPRRFIKLGEKFLKKKIACVKRAA